MVRTLPVSKELADSVMHKVRQVEPMSDYVALPSLLVNKSRVDIENALKVAISAKLSQQTGPKPLKAGKKYIAVPSAHGASEEIFEFVWNVEDTDGYQKILVETPMEKLHRTHEAALGKKTTINGHA